MPLKIYFITHKKYFLGIGGAQLVLLENCSTRCSLISFSALFFAELCFLAHTARNLFNRVIHIDKVQKERIFLLRVHSAIIVPRDCVK